MKLFQLFLLYKLFISFDLINSKFEKESCTWEWQIYPHILISVSFNFEFGIWETTTKKCIDSQFKGIIQHPWNKYFEKFTWFLQARICVDFNQPWMSSFINHEIISIDFKTKLSVVRVELWYCCIQRKLNMLVHFLFALLKI